ncbi:MAG: response regulator [Myxococcota bacterium]
MDTKKKILIVDDDEDVIEQLSMVLGGAGYEVHPAGSQAEGEEVLLSMKPDMAIVDLMMEEMDSGFVLAHNIRRLYPEIPIVMLTAVTAATGLSFTSTSAEARTWAQVDEIMDKPVRPEQVLSLVGRLLGERSARPGGAH